MGKNTRWILIGLIVIAGIYVLVDHGQHIVPYLPFAFLLGCLFMHVFMHSGHGGHGEQGGDSDQNREDHDQHSH